ncbi:MAG: ABC transporter ATP-binding protein [Bacillota bacterium]|nr:ABC transporter ATP-binding protein [Bacillota bacterium]
MEIIKVDNITKDYRNGKGVFDVSFSVYQGEAVGFLGPNGAGKTTTIRQLLGFIRPDKGNVSILALDCFREAAAIEKKLGYLPGEIAFMDDMTGKSFIKFIAGMKKLKNLDRSRELTEFFQLNINIPIKKMSKGMKQKLALVCCFMADPDIYILDEPTSGLDPLMQNKFVDLIKEEKSRGKTILMSSHIFEEVEKTCDRAVMIRSGRVSAVEDIKKLRRLKSRAVDITFSTEEEAASFAETNNVLTRDGDLVTVEIKDGFDRLISALSKYRVDDLKVTSYGLEELFMAYYGGEDND